MLQLLVTIPFPAGDFDFRFRHVKLGGWLGLEQLGSWMRIGWGRIFAFGRQDLKEREAEVLFVLAKLFGPSGRFLSLHWIILVREWFLQP